MGEGAAGGEGAAPVARGRDGRNYVVVSADTHASPDSLEHFLSYVDPAHREAVAGFGDMSNLAISMFGGFDPGEVDESDPVRATAARRLAGMGVDIAAAEGWLAHYGTDWVVPGDGEGRRLAVLEEQGIHAEVTLPGPILAGGLSPAMYLGATTDKGLEVVWPALHGYVRWLADFCAAAPGRRAGCMPIDFHDMDRAVEEVAWARGNGIFGGVMLPAMSVTSKLPGYADEYYEPFWSACEEHDMVVNLHTGASGSATDTKFLYDAEHGGMLGLYEVFVFTRRPLWFMIFGGVFDRHPDLKVVVTENGVQWLPSLIRDMESFFDTHGGAPVRSYLEMRPRDYFEKHVWMGGSLMKRYEAEMRHEIGIDKPGRGARTTPTWRARPPCTVRRSVTSSAACPRTTFAASSAPTPSTSGASTATSSNPWPTASDPPFLTWPSRWRWPRSRTPSAGAWPGRCRCSPAACSRSSLFSAAAPTLAERFRWRRAVCSTSAERSPRLHGVALQV